MHRMTIAEAVSYMHGLDRRPRQSWEQTRLLAGLVCYILTGQDYDPPFPWDEEKETKHNMSNDELENMQAKARAMEKWMNSRGGNL